MATKQTNKSHDVLFSIKPYIPEMFGDQFGVLIKVSKPFDCDEIQNEIVSEYEIDIDNTNVNMGASLDGFQGLILIDDNSVKYLKSKQTIYFITDDQWEMEIENSSNDDNNTSKNNNNNRRDSRIMCMYCWFYQLHMFDQFLCIDCLIDEKYYRARIEAGFKPTDKDDLRIVCGICNGVYKFKNKNGNVSNSKVYAHDEMWHKEQFNSIKLRLNY